MWNKVKAYIKANWYHWLTIGLTALAKWLKERKAK